ncbi:MAG: T9SS type A sorting domain-containing protein, partial [Bacteroidales bacterium]
ADTNYLAGEVITIRGPHHGYPYTHTLLAGLNKGDSMMIQNPVQSMFIIASRTGLWMTRNPLDFSTTPTWHKIGTTTGGVIQTFTISNDGDHVFVGTTAGSVFRFSNLRQAYDSLSADMTSSQQVITRTAIGSWSNRAVTSISIDPLNHDHVVVTLGNYGNTVFIYRSIDALGATPNWVAKMGSGTTKLPAMPVYASLITLHDPNRVIVGTELGTWMTENIAANSPIWTEINMGLDRVPTLMLHQQTLNFPYTYVLTGTDKEITLYEFMPTSNYGAIYAGTHGRGAFRNLDYVSVPRPEAAKPSLFKSQLLIYPNPVDQRATAVLNLNAHVKTTVNIFDLSGRVVKTLDAGTLASGRNELNLDLSGLKTGNYIIQVIAGGESKTAKIIKK